MSDTTSDFLALDQAAALIGRSHWTLRKWLDRGLLTRYKSSGRIVVRRDQLLELVAPREFPIPAR